MTLIGALMCIFFNSLYCMHVHESFFNQIIIPTNQRATLNSVLLITNYLLIKLLPYIPDRQRPAKRLLHNFIQSFFCKLKPTIKYYSCVHDNKCYKRFRSRINGSRFRQLGFRGIKATYVCGIKTTMQHMWLSVCAQSCAEPLSQGAYR